MLVVLIYPIPATVFPREAVVLLRNRADHVPVAVAEDAPVSAIFYYPKSLCAFAGFSPPNSQRQGAVDFYVSHFSNPVIIKQKPTTIKMFMSHPLIGQERGQD